MEFEEFNNLFSSIKKNINRLLSNKLKEFSINIPEGIYISILSRNIYLSFKDLTIISRYDKAMTTRIINKLKIKGLVNCIIRERKPIFFLTDKGKVIANNINKSIDEFKVVMNNNITIEDKNELKRLLVLFNSILEGENIC